MTTVITGATGQVGMHLVDALIARGRKVRAFVLPNEELDREGVEVVRGDVRDLESLRRAFRGASSVFHLAAVVSTRADAGPLLFGVNIDGARNAARAAREAGVERFVHFSSMVVFDPSPRDRPLDERRPRASSAEESPYTISKVVGEHLVRDEVARGLGAVVVHPTVIVGPNEKHHDGIVRGLIARHYRGQLPAMVSGCFNLVDVLDVVEGALLAEQHGRVGESYILGGLPYTVEEVLRVANASCGRPVPRFSVPASLAKATLPLAELSAKITGTSAPYNKEDMRQLEGARDIRSDKARRELGYRPRPIDDAIRRAHAWLEMG
jgi:dihydroflavonol-4-reductase